MRRKVYKGRCRKRTLPKCQGVCRTYDEIQYAFANRLQNDNTVVSFQCHVPLEGLTEGEYTSDFVCIKLDGSWQVRECVFRRLLVRPTTARLLDLSRTYWAQNGITDWGIVIEQEDAGSSE